MLKWIERRRVQKVLQTKHNSSKQKQKQKQNCGLALVSVVDLSFLTNWKLCSFGWLLACLLAAACCVILM